MPRAKRHRPSSLTNVLDTVATHAAGLVSHNIRLGLRRTSLRLDDLTWRSLHEMAQREGMSVHDLCAMIELKKPPELSLSPSPSGLPFSAIYCATGRQPSPMQPAVSTD
jgi:Ribbon-helix-helix domain